MRFLVPSLLSLLPSPFSPIRYSYIPRLVSTLLAAAYHGRRSMHSSPPASRDPVASPDFSKYRAPSSAANRNLSYFMVGTMGVLTAAASKSVVVDLVGTLSASADVLALAKIEVNMASIPEGKNVVVKWRGKPVFIRHRTADEIAQANKVEVKSLRDPQADSDRVQQPEWCVLLLSLSPFPEI